MLCQALVLNSPSVLTRSSQHPGMEELYCLPRATDVKQKQGVSLLVPEPGFRPGTLSVTYSITSPASQITSLAR